MQPETETVTVLRDDLDILLVACLKYLPDNPDPDIPLAFSRLNDARRKAPAAAGDEPESTSLVLIDCRCGHPRCDEQNAYRMVGHCSNCGRTGLIGLFSAGHEVGQGVLGRATCPTCGNRTCRWDRLATPDETPGEATP